jgi:NADH dehydrogenase FAD-containing subunit
MDSPHFKEITVLGAGSAGMSFIKSLRGRNKDIKITLIDKGKYYFDRKKFIETLNTKEYLSLADFSNANNVEFIQEIVTRINPERKKIYFKEKEPIDFKVLVIAAGVKSKNISIKGDHREGFSYLSDIELFIMKDLLKICDEAIGYVSTILGIKLAFALKLLTKDVRILADSWEQFASSKEKIIGSLEKNNIPFHLGVSIEEVIGEGQVKATKINPLKVFSSQFVFIDSGFTPNLGFFEEGIETKEDMTTNYADIYVAGDANAKNISEDYFYLFNQEEAQTQGALLAHYLLDGRPPSFQRKIASEEEKARVIEDMLQKVESGGQRVER